MLLIIEILSKWPLQKLPEAEDDLDHIAQLVICKQSWQEMFKLKSHF